MSATLVPKPSAIGSQNYAVGFVGDIEPTMSLTGAPDYPSPSQYVIRAKVGATATAGQSVVVGPYSAVIASTPSPGGIRSGTAQQALRDLYSALITDPAIVGRYELALNAGIVQGGDTFDELSIEARVPLSSLDLSITLGATSGLELARDQPAVPRDTAGGREDWQAYLDIIILEALYGNAATILTGYTDSANDRDFDGGAPPSWSGGVRTTAEFFSGTHSYAATWQAGTPTTVGDLDVAPGVLTPNTRPVILRFKARGTTSCTTLTVNNDGTALGTFGLSATEWRTFELLIPEAASDFLTFGSTATGGTTGQVAFYLDDYDYLTVDTLPDYFHPTADIDLADTGETTRLTYPYRSGQAPSFDVGSVLRTYLRPDPPFQDVGSGRITQVPFVAWTYAYGETYVPSGQTAPFAVPITSYGGAGAPSLVYYALLGTPSGSEASDFLDDGKIPALVAPASRVPTEDDPSSALSRQVKWTVAGVLEWLTVLNGPQKTGVWKVRYERTYEDGDTDTTFQEIAGDFEVPFNVFVLGTGAQEFGSPDVDDIPVREVIVTVGFGATGNDASFTQVTTRRRYRYVEPYRTTTAKTMAWLNGVGGWDSLPVADYSTETLTARRGTFATDEGLRSSPIETTRNETFTVTGLSRDDMLWLRDLVASRYVYLGTQLTAMERVTVVEHSWQVDQATGTHSLSITLGYDVDVEGV